MIWYDLLPMSKCQISFLDLWFLFRLSQPGVGDLILSGPQIYFQPTWTIASSWAVLIENWQWGLQSVQDESLENTALIQKNKTNKLIWVQFTAELIFTAKLTCWQDKWCDKTGTTQASVKNCAILFFSSFRLFICHLFKSLFSDGWVMGKWNLCCAIPVSWLCTLSEGSGSGTAFPQLPFVTLEGDQIVRPFQEQMFKLCSLVRFSHKTKIHLFH